ncbi:MAG: glycoside hydrolase family 3 N-terminal domain-containing protein [Acidimicrobiales bacterium]
MSLPLRNKLVGLAALVSFALVIALTGDDRSPADSTAPSPASTLPTTTLPTTTLPTISLPSAPTTTTTDPRILTMTAQVDELVADATPKELAYRLVVTGLDGAELGAQLEDTVGSVCVGGVFLTESRDNWVPEDDPAAFRAAVDDLDERVWGTRCTFRPLITTDAELGEVIRVPADSPAAAPSWAVRYIEGEPYNVLLDLQEQSFTYATALRELGIDVNFGAVADVDTAPDHFMARRGRSFGGDPGIVASLSSAVVQGHCAAGLAATLKHFPNQGATFEDPHAERSTAVGGVDHWETTGRLPYETTSAPLVMTGHIFMDIDPDLPASMSATVTTGLLRDELGYDGVVITDDLSTMRGAIDVIAEPGERAVAAIRAGADLVLFVVDDDIAPVVEALSTEMETDPAFELRARDSVRRALMLRLALTDPGLFPLCGSPNS